MTKEPNRIWVAEVNKISIRIRNLHGEFVLEGIILLLLFRYAT